MAREQRRAQTRYRKANERMKSSSQLQDRLVSYLVLVPVVVPSVPVSESPEEQLTKLSPAG